MLAAKLLLPSKVGTARPLVKGGASSLLKKDARSLVFSED